MSTGVKLGYVPVPDRETGLALGKALVAAKQVACANLLGPMTSIYEWEGAQECAEEFLLLLKTTADCAESAGETLAETHPYDCPCILWFDVEAGHPPFLDWVQQQTA